MSCWRVVVVEEKMSTAVWSKLGVFTLLALYTSFFSKSLENIKNLSSCFRLFLSAKLYFVFGMCVYVSAAATVFFCC